MLRASGASSDHGSGCEELSALRSGGEVCRQPGPDRLGDHLAGAVLGVAQAARLGKALLLARDVVGDAREGHVAEDDFAGFEVDEVVVDVEAEVLEPGTRAGEVDDDGEPRRVHRDVEPIGGLLRVRAAVDVEHQRVADVDRDARFRRSVGGGNLRDVDGAHRRLDVGATAERVIAVNRLEAARQQAGRRERRDQPDKFRNPQCTPQGARVTQTTTFTILCRTIMTFLGCLPSKAFLTASSARTPASISSFAASRATVTSARFLPLIWTGKVTVSSTSSAGSTSGQAADATGVWWPSTAQHSSARCGIIGWKSCTRMSAASRIAQARSGATPPFDLPAPASVSADWSAVANS